MVEIACVCSQSRVNAMGKTLVYEWFARFKNGNVWIADNPHSGRPSTAQIDENDLSRNEN